MLGKTTKTVIKKGDTRLQQDMNVTGVDASGTAKKNTTIGIQDNRKIVFVNFPQTSKNGDVFNSLYPRTTDVTSPEPGKSKIKYDKVDGRCELTSKVPVQTCPGKKRPCGALLTIDQNFCTQCKWKVDKGIFNTEEMICNGRNEDGSACNANIPEGTRFCSMCGEKVLEASSALVFTCSGKTSEGVACDYCSSRSFDTCPKCNSDSKPRDIRREISCPGEKHPCGTKLTVDNNYCPQCQWKVNKELFDSENRCKRLTENGSLCMAQIKDEDIFCSKCGNGVSKDPLRVRQSLILSPDPPFPIPEEVKSRWVLSNVKIGDYLITVMHHGQQALLRLFMVIHQTYRAILNRVDDGSLVFTFLHETKERAQEMIDDKENVKRLLAKFLEELDASVLYDHLDLAVELLTDQMKEGSSVETLEAHLPTPETKKTDIRSTQVRPEDEMRMKTTIHDLQRLWSKQSQPFYKTVGQRSAASQQPSPSDVTDYVHRSAREKTSDARTSNTEAGTRKKDELFKSTRKVSESAKMRPVSGEDVTDTVSITDFKGQKLLPGDAVRFRGNVSSLFGIYIGSEEVVACEEDSLMVKKMKLNLTDPFRKVSVISGRCQVSSPRERVERATSKIGERYTEGDRLLYGLDFPYWDGSDFPEWVYTGLGLYEARRKGFWLEWH